MTDERTRDDSFDSRLAEGYSCGTDTTSGWYRTVLPVAHR